MTVETMFKLNVTYYEVSTTNETQHMWRPMSQLASSLNQPNNVRLSHLARSKQQQRGMDTDLHPTA